MFDGAIFTRRAGFSRATFAGTASFKGAIFIRDIFEGSIFVGGMFVNPPPDASLFYRQLAAAFDGATFNRDASFVGATFAGTASFGAATFAGTASLMPRRSLLPLLSLARLSRETPY